MAIPGYRILRKIRQGGMSTVYLALQKSIDREVAIKVMSPSLSADPSFGSRFYREAKIVGQLSHPNIVSIYDVGSHRHYNYIAMDYLPGAPLQDQLDEGISTEQAVRIVREMASALDYAHERGYIHRDIKPDNILFREDGTAVLCDFGIAKALKGNIKMTVSGSVLGTPHYMSPEQAQGKTLDGRADIYSLGVVFFEMLSGQVPFSGDDAVSVAVKHMTSPIPKLPATVKAFQPIIDKMMEKKTSARFQTGKEVIAALDELMANLQQRGPSHLTQTGSTTVQVVGLISALVSTIITSVSMSIKRLALTKIDFSSGTTQLSNQQLEDIDTFIMNDSEGDDLVIDDAMLIQDTIEQPAIRYNFRWIYIPLAAACGLAASFVYFNQQPESPAAAATAAIAAPIAIKQALNTPESTAQVPAPEEMASEEIDEDANGDSLLAEQPADEQPAPAPVIETPLPTYSLTINTQPSDAEIRIINIRPKYQPGMTLKSGAYHVAVSAENYFPLKQWVRISNKDTVRTIELEPMRRLMAVGTDVIEPLKDGGNAPTMIVVPAGSTALADGYTLHFAQGLAVAKTEITFAQYQQFVDQTNSTAPGDFGWGRDTRPVIGISYQQALAYTEWLSQQTGSRYRLLSAEEWQYIAHGGQTGNYWWGNKSAKLRANCKNGCKSKFSKLFSSRTAPVASYTANPYGLFDTSGNVAEWVNACGDAIDSCTETQIAGGSHLDKAEKISNRSLVNSPISTQANYIGFRVLLEL